MINVQVDGCIRIHNDGILIVEGKDLEEVKAIVCILLEENEDSWEVELLNKILYTINNNLSTMEVA